MSNDLLFSVLPREGKPAIEKDELKVKQVEKEAKLRRLSDEEQEMTAEERDAREKHQRKQHAKSTATGDDKTKPSGNDVDPELPSVDEHGRKHLDIYI